MSDGDEHYRNKLEWEEMLGRQTIIWIDRKEPLSGKFKQNSGRSKGTASRKTEECKSPETEPRPRDGTMPARSDSNKETKVEVMSSP